MLQIAKVVFHFYFYIFSLFTIG